MEIRQYLENFKKQLRAKQLYTSKLLKDLSRVEKLLKEPISNVFNLSREMKEMENKYKESEYFEQLNEVISMINEMRKRDEEEFIYNFSRELKEAFEKKGLQVTGSYPEYTVGIFNLMVDFGLGRASIYFCKELIRGNIVLDINKIISAFERADKEIEGRRFGARAYINLLWEAYKRVILLNGLEIGKRVNVIEVMRELAILMQGSSFIINPKKENYKSYSRAYFSYDLYRLKVEGNLEYAGKRLNLGTATIDYTGKDRYSLYVYDDLTGGNYVMYIAFTDIVNKEERS